MVASLGGSFSFSVSGSSTAAPSGPTAPALLGPAHTAVNERGASTTSGTSSSVQTFASIGFEGVRLSQARATLQVSPLAQAKQAWPPPPHSESVGERMQTPL